MKNQTTTRVGSDETKTSDRVNARLCAGDKLISMTNFVLNQMEINSFDEDKMSAIWNYAKFLKQPITLGMFVPTDNNGKVLKGKPLSPNTDVEWIRWENEQEVFYKAKELVLFEGFDVKTKTGFNNGYDFIVDKNEIFYPFWYNPFTGWELSKGLKTVEDLVIYGLCVKLDACT